MRNSETGEYELVMGNRQLLSGFFIVALLFGVAFAMGYIVGRNASSPSLRSQGEPIHAIPPSDPQPNSALPATPATAPSEQPRTEALPPATVPPSQSPTETVPVQQAAAKSEEPARPAQQETSTELAPGTYWQVIAVAQAEAESVRKVLREKNFQVTLSPGTKNLTRVIVGPYPDRESLGKAKTDLENAGFHPIVLRK
jgi:cell division septation protein DedD